MPVERPLSHRSLATSMARLVIRVEGGVLNIRKLSLFRLPEFLSPSIKAIDLGPHVLGALEYCHSNFTDCFWSDTSYPLTFFGRRCRPPCYFNTGIMVRDLERWRTGDYTKKLESWMEIQEKEAWIYGLGLLPPFLLAFAGES